MGEQVHPLQINISSEQMSNGMTAELEWTV